MITAAIVRMGKTTLPCRHRGFASPTGSLCVEWPDIPIQWKKRFGPAKYFAKAEQHPIISLRKWAWENCWKSPIRAEEDRAPVAKFLFSSLVPGRHCLHGTQLPTILWWCRASRCKVSWCKSYVLHFSLCVWPTYFYLTSVTFQKHPPPSHIPCYFPQDLNDQHFLWV